MLVVLCHGIEVQQKLLQLGQWEIFFTMVSESLQFSVGVFSPKLKYKLEKGAFQRFERCVSVFWQSLLSAACLKFQAPCSRKELNIAVDNKANAEGNVFQP